MAGRGDSVRFRVRTRRTGIPRELTVRVYDRVEDLRDDSFNFAVIGTGAEGRGPEAADSDMVGVFQGQFREMIGKDGSITDKPPVGIMRLWKARLGSGVIAHEVTHVAMAIWEKDMRDPKGYDVIKPWDSMDREEDFCHLVGELMAKVTNGLYNHGCFGT